jgi:hypothetical protein
MKTRSEYIEQLKQNLDQWNTDLAAWEAKARLARTDVRIEYEMQLEALRKHRDDAATKLSELQASGEEAWQSLAEGADAAWAVMRGAFEKAAAHFHKE